MNINDFEKEINIINNRVQLLDEQIKKLEEDRLRREESQITLVGQEKPKIPKTPEQVSLENERQELIINKNRIINTMNSYNRIKKDSDNSDFKGMDINDFIRIRDNYDKERKEILKNINKLEGERIQKELDSLTVVGKIPKVSKSKEQIELEEKKQLSETRYQLMVNTINIYNGYKKELESLANETDLKKKADGIASIIYNANKRGFPEQLLVNLLEGKEPVKKEEAVVSNEPKEEIIEVIEDNTNNIEKDIKKEFISDKKTIFNSREEEIKFELDKSMKRLQVAILNDDENAIAEERSYRQSLLNELFEIKRLAKEEEINKKVKELEEELKKTVSNIDEAKLIGDDNLIAREIGNRQRIQSEIARLKGFEEPKKINSPVIKNAEKEEKNKVNPIKVENPKIIEPEKVENPKTIEPEKVKETNKINPIKIENPRVNEEPKKVGISKEEINKMISILNAKKEDIDSKIIKIDLNAPFEETAKQMKEYIKTCKEINKLKEELYSLEEKPKAKEEISEVKEESNKEEVSEVKEESNKEEKSEVKNEEKEEKKKRTPKFKRFLTKSVPGFLKRTGFKIRSIFDRSDEIDFSSIIKNEDDKSIDDEKKNQTSSDTVLDEIGKEKETKETVEIKEKIGKDIDNLLKEKELLNEKKNELNSKLEDETKKQIDEFFKEVNENLNSMKR